MTDKLIEQINASRSGKGSGPWTRDMEDRIIADAEVIKAAEAKRDADAEVIKVVGLLVYRLKKLQTYFDLSDEELDSMTPPERADTIRQHRLITETLDAFSRATQGRKGGE